jgi:hypothetical protein
MTYAEVHSLPWAEKKRYFEKLWKDLAKDKDHSEPPAWHGEALLVTEQWVTSGKAKFYDLDESMRRIREKISIDS